MAKLSRSKQLTLAEQRKIAKLASRPDAPLAMELRVWLLEKLLERREWLWEQIQRLTEAGGKDTESQTRMVMTLIDRILPTQREVIQAPENNGPQQVGVAIKIVGVARGTVQARQQALEVQAEKRQAPAALTHVA